MALKDDLEERVKAVFADAWSETEGRVVPEPKNVGFGNKATALETATVLYADLSSSTNLVDNYKWHFAAEIYKTYLYCAARIIRAEGGDITAYDGDRVMAVFLGDTQSSSAARCGLKINWAVINIINPALKKQYPSTNYVVKQTVGIDVTKLRAARTGVRGDNDLVWIGRAANYAAKLTTLSSQYPTRLTKAAYNRLIDSVKYGGSEKKPMWEEVTWGAMNDMKIYRSNWSWAV